MNCKCGEDDWADDSWTGSGDTYEIRLECQACGWRIFHTVDQCWMDWTEPMEGFQPPAEEE